MMKLLLIGLLAACIQTIDATVVIRYVWDRTQDPPTEDTDCLRGTPPGDIWGPAVSGSNKLMCGQLGNRAVAPARRVYKVSDTIEIDLHFGSDHSGGVLNFSVTYGTNPNMYKHPGWQLTEPIEIAAGSPSFTANVPLSKLEFASEATLQISFEPTVQPDNTVQDIPHRNYQCVDIKIEDGTARIFPPTGYGDPTLRPPHAPEVKQTILVTQPAEASLELIHYILFAVVAILLICFIITWIRYKSATDDNSSQPEFAPQIAVTERIQEPAEPQVKKEVPPPVKESDSSGSEQEPAPAAKAAPPAEANEEIKEQESGDPGDGSKGRHFHFRYVED